MFDNSVPEPGQLAGLSDAELIDAAAVTTRAENAACARKLAVMAELFIRRTGLSPDERELWWVDPEAAVSAEIAAAHNITSGLALHQTHRGVALRDRLPKVAALFFAGLINDLLVREIVSRTYLVERPDLMAALDADLAAEILGWGPLSVKKTRTRIDDLVERHDPGALREARASENQRSVSFGNPTDAPGFTSVNAVMFNCDAATAERNLTQMVYSVCDSDSRTVEERRNDAFAAIQAGLTALACQCGADDCEAAARPTPLRDTTVYVLTDATTPAEKKTDAGAAPKPQRRRSTPVPAETRSGYVFGAGIMPAPLLQGLLEGAKFREIIHPGQAAAEPGRFPSRALADFIRCRDLTCRFPGCDKPATDADIDHTVPHPVGPTHPSNLKCLCRFHHLLKTFWVGATGWRDRQYPDGTVVWTAPTGHTYTTQPGSRLLHPTLCKPTATLWTGDPPRTEPGDRRGKRMPLRRNTRAYNRRRTIAAERKLNDSLVAERDKPPPL